MKAGDERAAERAFGTQLAWRTDRAPCRGGCARPPASPGCCRGNRVLRRRGQSWPKPMPGTERRLRDDRPQDRKRAAGRARADGVEPTSVLISRSGIGIRPRRITFCSSSTPRACPPPRQSRSSAMSARAFWPE